MISYHTAYLDDDDDDLDDDDCIVHGNMTVTHSIIIILVTQQIPTRRIPTRWEYVVMIGVGMCHRHIPVHDTIFIIKVIAFVIHVCCVSGDPS